MKICGIITEYNPFHLGHAYQIEETRRIYEADIIIVVMSGNFVQRGEPAVFDQFTRTEMALEGGADIVIQLPTYYATASAENFAYGAVSLLHSLGVVDILCFGSESGELENLKDIAGFLAHEPANYQNALKSELKKGYSFAKARSLALEATLHHPHLHSLDTTDLPGSHPFDTKALLKGSNNILAIEYMKSLHRCKSHIEPVTVKRVGASYLSSDFDQVLPSATAIRKHFQDNSGEFHGFESLQKAIPPEVIHILRRPQTYLPLYMEDLYPYLLYNLELSGQTDIRDIYDLPLQLYQRLKNKLDYTLDYKTFLDQVLSKNFTKTSVQRSLLHQFLNIKTSDLDYMNTKGHSYIRVLGFKKEASKALHLMKKETDLPIITNVKDHARYLSPFGKHLLETEITYTNLYHQVVYKRYGVKKNNDYRQPVIVV